MYVYLSWCRYSIVQHIHMVVYLSFYIVSSCRKTI